MGKVWRAPFTYLATVMLMISGFYLAYLFRVRRNDGPYWDAEEARREDWERRGRRL